jgi:hypothetical protein
VAKAPVTARSRPPVASSTIRVGWRAWSWSTSVVTPLGSLGTAHRAPEGRTAMSNWAFATSIPIKHGTSRIRTPVGPPLQRRAHWHQTTVRAWGVQDVTTRATLRSRRTTAQSVYHVRELHDGHCPPSLIKIQGWKPSPAPSMPLRAAPTAETGLYHHSTIAYNRTEQSRVQTQQSSGDSRPALHAGSRSRMCPPLVALTPMSTLLTTGD